MGGLFSFLLTLYSYSYGFCVELIFCLFLLVGWLVSLSAIVVFLRNTLIRPSLGPVNQGSGLVKTEEKPGFAFWVIF